MTCTPSPLSDMYNGGVIGCIAKHHITPLNCYIRVPGGGGRGAMYRGGGGGEAEEDSVHAVSRDNVYHRILNVNVTTLTGNFSEGSR